MRLNEGFEKSVTSAEVERWRYPRFFTDEIGEKGAFLRGGEAKHCVRVLRMKAGDLAVICDGAGNDYFCRVSSAEEATVAFDILDRRPNEAEASVYLRLFQCCPKSDKMEFIVQKAAELGASEVVPLLSKRCVSRPSEADAAKKLVRYQKIAYEASKQCGRGRILAVRPMCSFREAVEAFRAEDLGILCYECGGEPIGTILSEKKARNIDLFIGSEGGFTPEEVDLARERGIAVASLGKRILRCETAPIAALSVLMNLTGNL
ncbi:MAG: 16S rRNA (uracil(1498)-N(3))-methyltransferase [Bacteroides sp.]|nr:16S rRNA (uracil(1498)-N(3))-methyltransferase [Eubacterium sp.]MCM1418096.1 16S rRNA (uracil(1498)-N(3))-methyltransferase [Roseburia sp.]MCM1462280.1 16S rRNA (uracil(1498)-N(3))-methyltransferase [Bacteroides sp.]